MYSNYVYLVDRKASGVHGGNSTVGSWETRDITDEVEDDGNLCSLAANQFILQAGTYRCLISAPAFETSYHHARLYNITDGALELLGTTEWNDGSANDVETRSFIVGRFMIASPKVFEVQHRVNASKAGTGYGLGNAWGDNFYTLVELWQETP